MDGGEESMKMVNPEQQHQCAVGHCLACASDEARLPSAQCLLGAER